MAAITAQDHLKPASAAQSLAPDDPSRQADEDHGLARFFFAAAAALILSAIQGVTQRLPGISDWLTDADYGGHMVTNLALTHITIVGAGTISLTGLIYYVLPKVTHRPLFSKSLTNLSFWATIIGVFSFYIAMLSIGIFEGAMIHNGWREPGYEAVRTWMGAWHKAPMAVTAAIMGLGYWTFVTNVYVTVARASAARKAGLPGAPTANEFLIAKFFAVGATGLLIGTVQGVYQVLPWMLDWLHATGEAGRMIDPMAHAHMNLVGGVSVSVMGLLYFFLPRMLGRPVFSQKLGTISFITIVIGVFGFYLSAVTLGFIEGNMMLDNHMSSEEAKEAVGAIHPLLLALSASIMGIGFWTFITNVFLTLRQKRGADAPADHKLAYFFAFSMTAILLGTIQGVIQILEPVEEWLDEAKSSGYLVTPLAHAQLNMVGFAIMSLATMSIFLLPRILNRPIADPVGGRRALMVIAVGIACSYLVFLGVGLLESMAIHNGVEISKAPDAVVGKWGRYALFAGAQGIVGLGYLMFFRHIARTIGGENIRAYFRTFGGRMHAAGTQAIRVHPRALPDNPRMAQANALKLLLLEVAGGALGFLGIGWIFSGRPFVGIMVLGSWAGGFWTFSYVVLAVAGGAQLLPVLLIPYFSMPVLSAIGCYRSYMRDARRHLAATA